MLTLFDVITVEDDGLDEQHMRNCSNGENLGLVNFDDEILIDTPWSDESKNEKRKRLALEALAFRDLMRYFDLAYDEKLSQDDLEMLSGMEGDLPTFMEDDDDNISGEREVVDHVAVDSGVKCLFEGSDSRNVVTGSTSKRKRSEQDEIASGYAPIGSQRKRRILSQEEVGGKAIFDDVSKSKCKVKMDWVFIPTKPVVYTSHSLPLKVKLLTTHNI
ncbi:hypothetical protein Tco_0682721 [Tanacetum coccineum]|uniref:Uncharacterized protein n=1 Tax=Tanacetum coccineum TaxID=301880 RepID=A0ABQ4XSJ8_9ASTR